MASERLEEFGKKTIAKINALTDSISKKQGSPIKIMHVCGTHEYTIANSGLKTLLNPNLKIISGPGCPVCVCPTKDIIASMQIAQNKSVILTSFGDMMRVPVNNTCLNDLSMKGCDIRTVYGPNDAIEIAKKNPDKEVVFFSVGFETTTPLIAYELFSQPPENFSVIVSNKLVPPAMETLMNSTDNELQGFILPGHVSAIIGVTAYRDLFNKFKVPMSIAGFEISDVLISLYMILKQIDSNEPELSNSYTRVVKEEGNVKAREIINKVFEVFDSEWRGIGTIEKSGNKINKEYERYDALKKFDFEMPVVEDIPKGCICNKIILGKSVPQDCPMFGKRCVPQNPYGSCMVSHEGTCRIAYIFEEHDEE